MEQQTSHMQRFKIGLQFDKWYDYYTEEQLDLDRGMLDSRGHNKSSFTCLEDGVPGLRCQRF